MSLRSSEDIIFEETLIPYNFDMLAKGISALQDEEDSCIMDEAKSTIQSELNRFFKDAKCAGVIYTENTDKEFFGIYIKPTFNDFYGFNNKLMSGDDVDVKIQRYLIEFDSKLFNPLYGFTPMELLSLIIHDVNAMLNQKVLKDLRCSVDHILCSIGHTNSQEFWDNIACRNGLMFNLLEYSYTDFIRKTTSIFEADTSDFVTAGDFERAYGLSDVYDDAIQRLKLFRGDIYNQVNKCNTLALNWVLSISQDYSDIVVARILEKMYDVTPSKLVKINLKAALESCKMVMSDPSHIYRYHSALTESSNSKKKPSLFTQMKVSGIRSLEDDVYEYKMRIKNVETENEAINVMRQINNRIGIISDYIETEDLDEREKDRMYKLLDKYDNLREQLSNKTVYNKKMYGLFVDYNALKQMSDANYATMNTYY